MARMQPHPPASPRGILALLFVAVLALAAAGVRPAAGQVLKPWAPAGDTLVSMASSAKLRFQRQPGDTTGGMNFEAYQIVGNLARKLLASLGSKNLAQARVLEGTLDSLGLDVEVASDPQSNSIVFLLVRNPYKRSSDALGFLYWLRGGELRMQGVSFPSCRAPMLRTWYTGRPDAPYEAVVLFHRRTGKDELCMRLFRMNPEGAAWNLLQYEGHGPEFGEGMQAVFADVNLDGSPEIVGWERAQPDSFLEIRSGAPQLINEFTYVERRAGFVVHDVRGVPGISETMRLFTLMLVQHQYDRARRLLQHPTALDSVVALGWGRQPVRGAFTIEYGEENEQWPTWLEVKVHQNAGWRRWIFHFTLGADGRWLIADWIPVEIKKRGTELGAPPDTSSRQGP